MRLRTRTSAPLLRRKLTVFEEAQACNAQTPSAVFAATLIMLSSEVRISSISLSLFSNEAFRVSLRFVVERLSRVPLGLLGPLRFLPLPLISLLARYSPDASSVDRDYGSGITTHRRRINRRRRRLLLLENAHGGGRHVSPSSSFSFVSLFLNKSVRSV